LDQLAYKIGIDKFWFVGSVIGSLYKLQTPHILIIIGTAAFEWPSGPDFTD
jgi:hypothetical protein